MTANPALENAPEMPQSNSAAREVWYDPAMHREKFSNLMEDFWSELQSNAMREALGRSLSVRLRMKQKEIQERLVKDFTLVVLGNFKRGKSTLINALVQQNLTTTDVTPETVTINEVRYGPELKVDAYLIDGGRVSLNVDELKAETLAPILSNVDAVRKRRLYAGKAPVMANITRMLEETFALEDLIRFSIDNDAFADFRKVTPQMIGLRQTVNELVEFAERRGLLADLVALAKSESGAACVEFEPFFVDPKPAPANVDSSRADKAGSTSIEDQITNLQNTVSHLSIQAPVEWLQGVCLVDTPGLEDTDRRFDRQVQVYLPRADAVIYLVMPNGALSATEQAFLQRSVLPRDFPKIVFVVNKLDQLNNEYDEQRVVNMVKDRLRTLFPEAPVFGVSAICEIEPNNPLYTQNPPRAKNLARAFQEFRDYINEAILLNRDLIQLDRAIAQAQLALNELEQEVLRLKHAMEIDKGQLEEGIAQCEDKNSLLHQQIGQRKEAARAKIQALYFQSKGWMEEFSNRVLVETIPSLSGMELANLQKHFHFFLSDVLHEAVRRCVEVHAPMVVDLMNETQAAIQSDFVRLVDRSAVITEMVEVKSTSVTVEPVSWSNLDTMDEMIDSSLIALFSLADSLSVLALGLLQYRINAREDQQVVNYQQKLRAAFPEIKSMVEEKVKKLYDEITQNVEKQVEQAYAQRIQASLSALTHARDLQAREEEKRSTVTAAVQKILDMIGQKRVELNQLRASIAPKSQAEPEAI